MSNTIKINEKTKGKFSLNRLERFVNSKDFEDLVLGYQMLKSETGKRKSFSSFKEELGL